MESNVSSFAEAPNWAALPVSSSGEQLVSYRFASLIGAILLSLIAYLAYPPKVDPRSPAFTKDTWPVVGAWRFFDNKWSFWKDSVAASKSGNFSFWLGRYQVVSLIGEAARRVYLESRDLDFLYGNTALLGLGPDYQYSHIDHDIHKLGYHNGRSWFYKRIQDLMKTDQLSTRLPRIRNDARGAIEALGTSGVTNPFMSSYPTVLKMSARICLTDILADDEAQFDRLYKVLTMFASTSSRHNIVTPFIPSISMLKRWYGRWELRKIMTPIVQERIRNSHVRKDDALQIFIDNRDPEEHIIRFLVSISFIAVANAGILAGVLLNIMANRQDWQEKVYEDAKRAAAKYSTDKEASLTEQLESLPLEAWEFAFPSIDLCFKETIRMYTAFPMFRLNMSASPISIPGTNEVIPGHSLASYNTADVHYNEKLYPNPYSFDPERYSEGRREYEKEALGFVGWGHGRHPCLGMRWAKLQENMMLVYALAKSKWEPCDAQGQLLPSQEPYIDLDTAAPKLPQGVYVRYTPRP